MPANNDAASFGKGLLGGFEWMNNLNRQRVADEQTAQKFQLDQRFNTARANEADMKVTEAQAGQAGRMAEIGLTNQKNTEALNAYNNPDAAKVRADATALETQKNQDALNDTQFESSVDDAYLTAKKTGSVSPLVDLYNKSNFGSLAMVDKAPGDKGGYIVTRADSEGNIIDKIPIPTLEGIAETLKAVGSKSHYQRLQAAQAERANKVQGMTDKVTYELAPLEKLKGDNALALQGSKNAGAANVAKVKGDYALKKQAAENKIKEKIIQLGGTQSKADQAKLVVDYMKHLAEYDNIYQALPNEAAKRAYATNAIISIRKSVNSGQPIDSVDSAVNGALGDLSQDEESILNN